MLFSVVLFSALIATVSAHFQLQFPEPRGPFVEDNEPNFCDGYNTAVDNRTVFPLDNGVITLNSEHPKWSAAVLISIDQNPTNFSVFNKSSTGIDLPLVHSFFSASGEGAFCIPLDIGAANISGVGDGSNVTIQVEFNGGDGSLFQCADLTLSKSVSTPSNITSTCTSTNVVGGTLNGTSTANSSGSAASPTNSAPSSGQSSGAEQLFVGGTSGLMLAAGALIVNLF